MSILPLSERGVREPNSPDVQRLKGQRSTRAVEKAVQYAGGLPKMPGHLSELAAAEWRRVCRELRKRKTVSRVDGSLLELYCELYARWRLCLQDVAGRGIVVEVTVLDKSGEAHSNRRENPAAQIASRCETQMRQLLKELGATPRARETVKPAKVEPSKDCRPGTVGWYQQQEEQE